MGLAPEGSPNGPEPQVPLAGVRRLGSFRWTCAMCREGSQRSITPGIGAASFCPAAQMSIMVRTAGEPIASTIAAPFSTVVISGDLGAGRRLHAIGDARLPGVLRDRGEAGLGEAQRIHPALARVNRALLGEPWTRTLPPSSAHSSISPRRTSISRAPRRPGW